MWRACLVGVVAACGGGELPDEDGDGIDNEHDPCPITSGPECPETLFAALFNDPERAPLDWRLTGTWTFHNSFAEQLSEPATMSRSLEPEAGVIVTKLELAEVGLGSAVTLYAGGVACTLRDEGNGSELFLVTNQGAAVTPTTTPVTPGPRKLAVGQRNAMVTCSLGSDRLSLPFDPREWRGEMMLEGLNAKIRVLHVVVEAGATP